VTKLQDAYKRFLESLDKRDWQIADLLLAVEFRLKRAQAVSIAMRWLAKKAGARK